MLRVASSTVSLDAISSGVIIFSMLPSERIDYLIPIYHYEPSKEGKPEQYG
jgi:hypothetical protein